MWPAQVIQWSNPVTNTPSIIQVDFGAWGENVPGDGEAYCGPTSIVMGLYYLYANGFTQLAPGEFASQDDSSTVNLELIIAGLTNTSVGGGIGSLAGVGDYFSACGISPDQYSFATTANPDLPWIANQIAPNVAQNPAVIVLGFFSVGWYAWNKDQTVLLNSGGHCLAPLTADLTASQLTLNNSFPSSFFDVPNQPGSNPQTVGIAAVPPSWIAAAQGLDSSLSYTQVESQTEGQNNSYAILWGGQAWAIASAAATNPPSVWNLASAKPINTNGGTLNVIAPLAGSGGLLKLGPGMLCLMNDNSLSGANEIRGGVLASAASTPMPFGTGGISISGGGVLAVPSAGSPSLAIASGASLLIGPGAVLQLTGSAECVLAIGGYDDGSTPNVARETAGTLVVSLDAGIDQLGETERLMVRGSGGNLPRVTNGMVAPYIVGQNSDGSGEFLNYVASLIGFQAASTVSSADVDIASVASDVIYEVVNTQEVASGATASIMALEMNGGTIEGGGTVQIGSQASGDCAGVLLNAGNIAAGSLSFGGAEGVVYTGNGATTISACIAGSGGLTTFGPGALILTADNSTTLSGSINVASGALIAAGNGSATGSGDVVVNEAALLAISGKVAGNVSVGNNATLLLQGGTIQGSLTTAAQGENSAERGGILQGAGVVAGPATLHGLIQSGPTAGLLTFNQAAVVGEGDAAGFYWRLQALVDDSNSSPGVDWNALLFGEGTSFGIKGVGVTFYLDFSALGSDPDGPPLDSGPHGPVDPFWSAPHIWTLITFPAQGVSIWWNPGNFTYGAGNFDIDLNWDSQAVKLTWTPASTTQSLLQRMATRASLRRKAATASPQPNR